MFDTTQIPELDDQTIESELCSQAAHVAAGECRLLLLVGEFDRRGTWAGQGLRSCAHWLNWRVGTSMGAAREQVRVARALDELPVLRASFETGEISYSKVRAITRIATPRLEEGLVEMARYATASQLEQIVREFRRCTSEEAARAIAQRSRQFLRSYTDDDGMVVIHARLTPEDGAVVLAAIEAARAVLESAPNPPENVPAETLDGSWNDPWSPSTAAAERHADEPVHPFEADRADALVAACASVLARGLDDDGADPHVSVLVHVDEAVLSDPAAPGCSHIDGVGAVAPHVVARLACDATVSRLMYRPDGSVEPRGATRAIPRTLRRALHARDRGCRWPGCTAKHFLHAHHVIFWSRGGPTTLSNLVSFCSRHHRLAHEGGWRLELSPSGSLSVWSPDGTSVPMVGPPVAATGDLASVHAAEGLDIGPNTLAYRGERFDLGLTIDSLLSVPAETPES